VIDESKHPLLGTLLLAAFIAAVPSTADAQLGNPAVRQVVGDSRSRAVLAAARSGTYEEEPVLAQTAPQPTKVRDSLWDGMLLGAGVGALLGLIPDHYDDCEECHDSLYVSIAVGAGTGVLIDLLRRGKPSPSTSSKRETLQMGVTVSPRTLGLAGRIAWR
jgi:hypothetical protein